MTTSTIKEVLQQAYKYVKAGWTKGAYARDFAGKSVFTSSPDVCKMCLMGAVRKASYVVAKDGDARPVREMLVQTLGRHDLISFNDEAETNQERVLELINDAIERCNGAILTVDFKN